MQRSGHLVIWLLAAGCSIGAPPGFPSADAWTFPLVGPLENGALLAPVTIDGHGPYLFAIDPDALVSAVDTEVMRDTQAWRGQGPRRVDETYTTRPGFYAVLLNVKVGSLVIERTGGMVFPAGTYDIDGRHISGILGRDVLAESLVFGFDRDQGLATLSTVQAFAPPSDAVAIRYEQTRGTSTQPRAITLREFGPGVVAWTPRRLAHAEIGGHDFSMHLDLGGEVSQLDASKWAKAGLVPAAVHLHLTDEAGIARDVARAGIAASVRLGEVTGADITFAPYIDERFPLQGVDGALGLDFFRHYTVFAKWDNHTYYLKPRGDFAATTTARLGRWGAALPVCPHPGCVTAEVITGDAGPVLHVVRDPVAARRPLEVSLAVEGERATTVPLVVSLPPIADQVTRPISPAYVGATLAVVDVSPFPRRCPTPGGCVRQLGRVGPPGAPAPELIDVPGALLGLATPRP